MIRGLALSLGGLITRMFDLGNGSNETQKLPSVCGKVSVAEAAVQDC